MEAVLLAAGFSSRMGRLKQLMPIHGKPMICYTAESLVAAGLELRIVLGYDCEKIKSALSYLPYECMVNHHPEEGMFSSVKLGCQILRPNSACLIMPCDCPGVLPETIRYVAETLEQKSEQVVIPTFSGRRGHPCGLPAYFVKKILTLPNDTPGLRSLWQHTPDEIVHLEVDDAAILHDIDTVRDLQTIIESS